MFQLKCTSGGEYGETEIQITTSDGQYYDPVNVGIAGYSDASDVSDGGLDISARQTLDIVSTYQLPDNVTITVAQWTPYLKYSATENSHGEWQVQEQ